ncbi:MAG: DNA polymerase III subunit chi [Betaproteobacteria bacterium]|nr:MAG: DNA polymerase III subunit chi [Betaproteobacteria bacterium]
MTAIDFYTRVADRLQIAARLVAKAFAQHGRVRVLTPDAAATDALDRMLWMQPAIAFLPHCRLDSRLALETPIWVDHALEHTGPAVVLINLHDAPPPFFSRFERLAEIAGLDEAHVASARERYRFYRERGYPLRTHDLSERI